MIPPLKLDRNKNIAYRKWESPKCRAGLLLVHGLGAHAGRWKYAGDFFLGHGFSSYALELKGFGESATLQGHIDSFDTYYRDIRLLHDIIKNECAGKKIYLVGESMGGLIAFLASSKEPSSFDGLICISPAFKNRLKFSLFDYIKIFLSLIYNPKKQFRMPFDAEMCTRNAECQKKMKDDPNEHRLATSRLLLNLFLAQVEGKCISCDINAPLLFLLAGDDRLVVPATAKNVFRALKTEDKTLIDYPGMRHALSVELGREKVFGGILSWLEKRM